MKIKQSYSVRMMVLVCLMLNVSVLSTRMKADTGTCGGGTVTLPFTDVMGSIFFCQIAEAYFSGLTNGSTPTTYSPTQPVIREQMAAFTTRTLDQSIKRGSRKAVGKKFWTPQLDFNVTSTIVGTTPQQVKFDGTDLWVTNTVSSSVTRVRSSDGRVLDTWSAAISAKGIVCAMGRVFVAGRSTPGKLYSIDPTQPAGVVATLSSSVGDLPSAMAFDGSRLWTANEGGGAVCIVSLNPTTVNTVTGFGSLAGILFDGANIWVTDITANALHKVNAAGAIVQSINVGTFPLYPVFDGTNIWVPSQNADSVTVVRVKDAAGNPLTTAFVLATLTGNGLNDPSTATFDGERILVTNQGGNSVSLWKAADLIPLGSFGTGGGSIPTGACSDGLNFWITLRNTDKLARF